MLIIHRLADGPVGFNDLNRKTEGINATTMSHRLGSLEAAGIVGKTIHSTMPPRTSYELTVAGKALLPILDSMEKWASQYLADDERGCSQTGCGSVPRQS